MLSTTLSMILLAQTDDAERTLTWLETIQRGGAVGYLIIGMSVIALGLIIMHFVQIRRTSLMPQEQVDDLEGLLAGGDINGALEYCLNPENDSYLVRIMTAGLTRYQKSAFGAFEIKNAIEEAGDDQTARLYRSTDALGVIGAIAPLLGLLGTVLGMVGAFEAIGQTAGGNHEALAGNISLALVTTLMGLTLAIPCIALHTFFRNRIDTFASEAGMEIERLVLNLESVPGQGPTPASNAPRPQTAARVSGVAPTPAAAPGDGNAP